jgi:hypothetical protein
VSRESSQDEVPDTLVIKERKVLIQMTIIGVS